MLPGEVLLQHRYQSDRRLQQGECAEGGGTQGIVIDGVLHFQRLSAGQYEFSDLSRVDARYADLIKVSFRMAG